MVFHGLALNMFTKVAGSWESSNKSQEVEGWF